PDHGIVLGTAQSRCIVPAPGIAIDGNGAGVGVIGGLIALVVVLAAASAAGFLVRQRQGRFRPEPAGRPTSGGDVLSAADLGAPLGAQATLVQFSTKVCAYCGPTR